jgi:membrane protein implicated in regulation of membrane protease activity
MKFFWFLYGVMVLASLVLGLAAWWWVFLVFPALYLYVWSSNRRFYGRVITCSKCAGTGQVNGERCKWCKGLGKVDPKKLHVTWKGKVLF